MLIDQRNPEPYPYLRKRLFIQQERTVGHSIMLFVDMRRYKENHPFFSNSPHYQGKGFQRG